MKQYWNRNEFMQKRSLEISCYVLGAGAFGVFFRWLQDQMAFDAAGLAERSAFNVLVPLLVLAACLLFNKVVEKSQKAKLYIPNEFCPALNAPGKPFLWARWGGGAVMAIGGAVTIGTCETDPDATMLFILGILAIASGIAFPLVLGGANDKMGRLRHPDLACLGMSLPIALFALWLVLSYKQNALNSVIWSYLIEMGTMIVLILAYFRLAGFAFGPVKTWNTLFMTMLGAMMAVMSLADQRHMGQQIILVGTALQLVMYEWLLIMNMQQKKRKDRDDQPSPDGFERLR